MRMKIADRLQECRNEGRLLRSVEFFPPKTEASMDQFREAAAVLRDFQPDFVSVTYGAGGSTRGKSLDCSELLSERYGFDVMPHLTCVGHGETEINELLEAFRARGFENIMTLRGDPPKDHPPGEPLPGDFRYASELVRHIRRHYSDFCLGVAGYPEKHPEAPSAEIDLEHLAHKVEQGADFITTQLFLDNDSYFRFLDQAEAAGIRCPIIPGILPPLSLKQLERFCALCQATVPEALRARLAEAGDDADAARKVGVDWAYGQLVELIERGPLGSTSTFSIVSSPPWKSSTGSRPVNCRSKARPRPSPCRSLQSLNLAAGAARCPATPPSGVFCAFLRLETPAASPAATNSRPRNASLWRLLRLLAAKKTFPRCPR